MYSRTGFTRHAPYSSSVRQYVRPLDDHTPGMVFGTSDIADIKESPVVMGYGAQATEPKEVVLNGWHLYKNGDIQIDSGDVKSERVNIIALINDNATLRQKVDKLEYKLSKLKTAFEMRPEGDIVQQLKSDYEDNLKKLNNQ